MTTTGLKDFVNEENVCNISSGENRTRETVPKKCNMQFKWNTYQKVISTTQYSLTQAHFYSCSMSYWTYIFF